MKQFIMLFVLLFSISNTISAQQNEITQNQISVIGSVELKEIADQASFYFTIKGVGETLRLAVEDAENKTKILSEKIIQLGIKKNNISTSDFLSGENYGDKAFLSSSRDYQATIVTMIKTDSLDLLRSLLFLISEAEVENISTISFSLKDELGLRRRARIEAGLKAKEKAEDISNALGVKLGRVLTIEEIQPTQTYTNQNQYLYIRGGLNYPNPFNPSSYNVVQEKNLNSQTIDETKGSGFFAKTVSITSQVEVSFAIE
ncbi:MAG: DUF541 domain-containing protein [Chlorobi bacterium]|nr:DUF541 domain-containing protein [Ignavibacteriota bacterium]MBL1161191.1 DUF541 domain-containing protein [Chlorobiota bacterium]MCO6446324.1 SIMPL domain-containing protein [Ignavibacterium album]MCZ2268649.1 SIMPL domain-containing protein [Ignavibacteriales bacterium]HOJ06177.1 SIMPL domain-containing protein [Ignavibacteriaceae bacterium]